MGTDEPDLWTCPRCGARFVSRNMSHGCGDYTVDGYFEGTPAAARELYNALVWTIDVTGPFEQVPTKTRIAFKGGCGSRQRIGRGRTASSVTSG